MIIGKYFFGRVVGYGEREDGARISIDNHKYSFLVNAKNKEKIKKAFDSQKNVFIKLDASPRKCKKHSYELYNGSSKRGTVLCSTCGMMDFYDTRTKEEIQAMWDSVREGEKQTRIKELKREIEVLKRTLERLEKE